MAERYAHDVDPDDTFLSWSMAKSITNALIGILVRQGRLDIHQPIPVAEWGPEDPRSRISVDQLLRMVDGLRFREAEDLGGGSAGTSSLFSALFPSPPLFSSPPSRRAGVGIPSALARLRSAAALFSSQTFLRGSGSFAAGGSHRRRGGRSA